MIHDAFSPVAPARIRVLVVPIGVKRSIFLTFTKQLNNLRPVPLQALENDTKLFDLHLDPKKFLFGSLFYVFGSELATDAQQALPPFELFRDHVITLGLLSSGSKEDRQNALGELKRLYPKSLIHRIVAFTPDEDVKPEDEIFFLPIEPSVETLERFLLRLSSTLLEEWSGYVVSVQALKTVPSPAVPARQQVQSPSWLNDRPPSASSDNQPISHMPLSRELHRMSMPVHATTPTASSDNLSVGSPGFSKPPAKTFEEMTVGHNPSSALPTDRFKTRPSSMLSREESRDRVSVHGFGSESYSERTRDKGKARVGVVVASVYLHAGLWPQALTAAVESASKARWYSDHIWHGRALEIIFICMILLTWTDYQFQIPPVFQAQTDITLVTKHDASQYDADIKPFPDDSIKAKFMRSLSFNLPTSLNMILTIYDRAQHMTTGDYIPQVVLSEFSLRVSKFLAALHLGGGYLTDQSLSHMILGIPLEISSSSIISGVKIRPTKREISNVLSNAEPFLRYSDELDATDIAAISTGIGSVYGALGMHRKKALILKELVSYLIPALTQAQILVAAEAGLHPSAALTKISTSLRKSHDYLGAESFLNVLCRTYGVSTMPLLNTAEHPGDGQPDALLQPQIGGMQMKVVILNLCIQLCETLNHHQGILYYCIALLRIMGPNASSSTDAVDEGSSLSVDEQTQIHDKITKTIQELHALGRHDVEAEYWDDFLVRGLWLMEAPIQTTLRPHKQTDLKLDEKKDKDPFLHNPFLDVPAIQQWRNLLSASSEREFVVLLQNPFEFAVEVEYVKLVAGEDDLGLCKTNITLKPSRTQNISIPGEIDRVGDVEITGCRIKVYGCRERLFEVFTESWAPTQSLKLKGNVISYSKLDVRLSGSARGSTDLDGVPVLPKSTSLQLVVIPKQPVLMISNVSVPDSTLMLLEGESIKVSITLTNVSDIVADFIHVSFDDTISARYQSDLGQKGILPANVYEMEYQMTHLPTIKCDGMVPKSILPGESATFDFLLLARWQLSAATFHFDYTNLQTPHLQTGDTFFTRQLRYDMSITVNPTLQVTRLEVLAAPTNDGHQRGKEEEQCLILIDMRNGWNAPLLCNLQSSTSNTEASRASTIIKSGQIVRQVFEVPKLYIPNPYKRIVPLTETRKRQFVVSSERISPEEERLNREKFWYRQRLLDTISGSWSFVGDVKDKTGLIIDLRRLELSTATIEALKLPDVDVQFSILSGENEHAEAHSFGVSTDEFISLTITLYNRSSRIVYPLVRLQPHLADQPREISLDLSKRLAWNGVLQQAVGRLEPNTSSSFTFSFYVLAAGEYEISASVEETRASEAVSDDSDKAEEELDDLAKTVDRRVWLVGHSCTIVAQDSK